MVSASRRTHRGASGLIHKTLYVTSLEVRLRLREGNIREFVQGEGLLHQRLSASGNRQVYLDWQ
jgi:hypothetical protein